MQRPDKKNHALGRRQGAWVMGAFIDALDWQTAMMRISTWAHRQESRYVCLCNVHSLITARQDPHFLNVVNNADMATADGMPVAWLLRRKGYRLQKRINGPDLMWKYCAMASREKLGIFLFGSTPETLALLQATLQAHFPQLNIVGVYSPPFGDISQGENRQIVQTINRTGAGIVFVGLGCPKQEKWMAAQRGHIHAVMVGVGAAFDFHAGVIRRAPFWMQRSGLEWLFRFLSEPRRLWRRYLLGNAIFVLMVVREAILLQKKQSDI